MSIGYSYDMILLSIKGPGGARIVPTRSKVPRRPLHHASLPKWRRGQHHHRPTAAARSSPRAERATVQEPTAPNVEAIVTTAWRRVNHATASDSSMPRAPSPPTTLLPHGLFATRQALSFGLDNAAMSLARAIYLGAGTCVERPLVLLRDTKTRQQVGQEAEQSSSPRVCGCRRSLSMKFNYQINKEKDPNGIKI